jgi:hypothetical protein
MGWNAGRIARLPPHVMRLPQCENRWRKVSRPLPRRHDETFPARIGIVLACCRSLDLFNLKGDDS